MRRRKHPGEKAACKAKAKKYYQITGKAKARERYLMHGKEKAKEAYRNKGLKEEMKRKYRDGAGSRKVRVAMPEDGSAVCVSVAVAIGQA
jgi:hypothetical protein